MTSSTLERAARAVTRHWYENYFFMGMKPAEPVWDEMTQEQKDYAIGQARAVLMAVLPTLERYDYSSGGYEWPVLDSDPTGQFVYYDDLQAILNDGEAE